MKFYVFIFLSFTAVIYGCKSKPLFHEVESIELEEPSSNSILNINTINAINDTLFNISSDNICYIYNLKNGKLQNQIILKDINSSLFWNALNIDSNNIKERIKKRKEYNIPTEAKRLSGKLILDSSSRVLFCVEYFLPDVINKNEDTVKISDNSHFFICKFDLNKYKIIECLPLHLYNNSELQSLPDIDIYHSNNKLYIGNFPTTTLQKKDFALYTSYHLKNSVYTLDTFDNFETNSLKFDNLLPVMNMTVSQKDTFVSFKNIIYSFKTKKKFLDLSLYFPKIKHTSVIYKSHESNSSWFINYSIDNNGDFENYFAILKNNKIILNKKCFHEQFVVMNQTIYGIKKNSEKLIISKYETHF